MPTWLSCKDYHEIWLKKNGSKNALIITPLPQWHKKQNYKTEWHVALWVVLELTAHHTPNLPRWHNKQNYKTEWHVALWVVLELTGHHTPNFSEVYKGVRHAVLFRWHPCWTFPTILWLKTHFRLALNPSQVELLYIKEAQPSAKMFLNQMRPGSPSHITNCLTVWSMWISSHPICVLLKLNVTILIKQCSSNHKTVRFTNTITNVKSQI